MSPPSPALTASLEPFLGNLLAWSLQLALVAGAAALLTRVLPLERPGPRLALWQSLLALALLLPLLQPWRMTMAGISSSFGLAAPPIARLATAPGAGQGATAGVPWALGVTLALLGGVTLQLGRLAVGLSRVRRIRLAARSIHPPSWLDELGSRVAPAARFVASDQCGGPATFGVVRPTIVLPPSFERMPVDRQRAVALHELTHARRRDWLALVLEEILKALLFFHPSVHWIVGRIRLAREQCVDAEVVRSLGDRRAYLESLVEVARLSARAPAVPAATFLRERHLRERVELLLKEVPMSLARSLPALGAAAGAVVLASAIAAAAFPLVTPPSATDRGASAPGDQARSPEEPRKIAHVNPVYPKDAKEDRAQGIFLLAVAIDTEGRVSDAHVIVSTPLTEGGQSLIERKGTPEALQGDERLGRAAVDAVRQWRFEPILDEAGQPKAIDFVVTVRFVLS